QQLVPESRRREPLALPGFRERVLRPDAYLQAVRVRDRPRVALRLVGGDRGARQITAIASISTSSCGTASADTTRYVLAGNAPSLKWRWRAAATVGRYDASVTKIVIFTMSSIVPPQPSTTVRRLRNTCST